MHAERYARLFRIGSSQALRIPQGFELPGDEIIIRKEGQRLIVDPIQRAGLIAVLTTLDPLNEDFPQLDAPVPDDVMP